MSFLCLYHQHTDFPDINKHRNVKLKDIETESPPKTPSKTCCLYGRAIRETAKQLWPQSGDLERRLAPVTHAASAWLPLNAVSVCLQESQLCLRLLDSRILHLWVRMSDRVRERLSCCSNLIGHWDYFIFSINAIRFQAVKECRQQAGGNVSFVFVKWQTERWMSG